MEAQGVFTFDPDLYKYHLIALAASAVFLLFLQPFFSVPKDRREPPVLHASIPVIGHMLQLWRQGADYYLELERRYHQSLYLLIMGKGRMYIVASPEWTQAIYKAHKVLHFNTLVSQALKDLFHLDKPAMEIIDYNRNGEDGTRDGIVLEIHDMMAAVLAPGNLLDDINKSILTHVLPDVNALAKDGPVDLQLWSWLRHYFSIASVTALWGPMNPFRLYPDVCPAFWEFENSMLTLTMLPFPRLFARKGYNARTRLFEVFEGYMENEAYNEPGTSQLIKNRAEMNMGKFGMSRKMHARTDASLLIGVLVNTIPMAFWLMSYIFEDGALLADIREEIDACVRTPPNRDKTRVINATELRAACPLLLSAFRETLRILGNVNINRHVSEDVTITNSATGESYLLKKDAIVQVATNVIHQREDLFGADAAAFDPRRFMQTSSEKTRGEGSTRIPDPAAPFRDAQGKVHSGAFRSFGGGNSVCPGRHFAQTEILGLTSLFVAGFEIEGRDTPGRYKKPEFEAFKLNLGVVKPGTDVDVKLRRREGYESVEWAFEM